MGRDKASLSRDGETQLERAVRILGEHLDDVYVSTSTAQQDDPLRQRFRQIVDRYENLGPVAGILSAMDASPGSAWLVVACDLPNLDDATVRFLLDHVSREAPATAFVSSRDGLPEPLCAVYRPAARQIIEQFVADGIVCPRKMLINSPTNLLSLPNPDALHNVNTPDDLAGTGIRVTS